MKELETDIQTRILIAITALPGIMAWRQNTGALKNKTGRLVRFGIPGTPDILGCLKGRFFAIEVKTLKGEARESQKNWRAAFEKAGGSYEICRSPEEALSFILSLPDLP